MSVVYVNSADPVAEVKAFVTKFKIAENWKPLERMLERYAKRLVAQTAAAVTVPAAFATGDWSLTSNAQGTGFTLAVTALPASGGSTITMLQYKVGTGAWVDVTNLTLPISVPVAAAAGSRSVQLRAVNTVGPSASATKTVVVQVA